MSTCQLPPFAHIRRGRSPVYALAVGAFLAALTGCGQDKVVADPVAGAPSTTASAASPAADPAAAATPGPSRSLGRYCALSADLDQQGSDYFRPFEERKASDAEFAAAEHDFTLQAEAEIDELVAVAPAEIADDVAVDVRAVRDRAGLSTAPPLDSTVYDAAESRVKAFESANCPKVDPGSGK